VHVGAAGSLRDNSFPAFAAGFAKVSLTLAFTVFRKTQRIAK